MAGRYGIGRLVENKEFSNLQSKLDNLYDSYNVSIYFNFLKKISIIIYLFTLKSNSNCINVEKTCEIIEKNADVQRQLHGSLHDITVEG